MSLPRTTSSVWVQLAVWVSSCCQPGCCLHPLCGCKKSLLNLQGAEEMDLRSLLFLNATSAVTKGEGLVFFVHQSGSRRSVAYFAPIIPAGSLQGTSCGLGAPRWLLFLGRQCPCSSNVWPSCPEQLGLGSHAMVSGAGELSCCLQSASRKRAWLQL